MTETRVTAASPAREPFLLRQVALPREHHRGQDQNGRGQQNAGPGSHHRDRNQHDHEESRRRSSGPRYALSREPPRSGSAPTASPPRDCGWRTIRRGSRDWCCRRRRPSHPRAGRSAPGREAAPPTPRRSRSRRPTGARCDRDRAWSEPWRPAGTGRGSQPASPRGLRLSGAQPSSTFDKTNAVNLGSCPAALSQRPGGRGSDWTTGMANRATMMMSGQIAARHWPVAMIWRTARAPTGREASSTSHERNSGVEARPAEQRGHDAQGSRRDHLRGRTRKATVADRHRRSGHTHTPRYTVAVPVRRSWSKPRPIEFGEAGAAGHIVTTKSMEARL